MGRPGGVIRTHLGRARETGRRLLPADAFQPAEHQGTHLGVLWRVCAAGADDRLPVPRIARGATRTDSGQADAGCYRACGQELKETISTCAICHSYLPLLMRT